MAEKRRGGKPTDVLSVSLFLLEDRNVERINKNMCTKSTIERLKENGYGPPPEKFCQEKGKIDFPFLMTTEEFKNKIEEIYPKLQNQCYLLMRADKRNKLQSLDIASSSYNPKDIYNSNLGQGRLYIRFATETEVTAVKCMPPPTKIRRTVLQCRPILPKPAALILPNSAPNSTEGFSGPAQNVSVSQATTSENTDVNLPQNTDTTSNNTGTIFPTADNDSSAESIVQILLQNNELAMKIISDLFQKLDSGLEQFIVQYFLQNNELAMKVISGFFQKLDSGLQESIVQCLLQNNELISGVLQSLASSLEDVYTNNTSMLRLTNENDTLTSLGPHNNLQPAPSFNQSIPSSPQLPDNQMTSQENISSTTLHQHGVVNQVQSFISSQPDSPGTSALEQHPSDNTNISPVLSSTSNVSQPTMDVDSDQQLYPQDLTGGIDLLLHVHETSQNGFIEQGLSPFEKLMEDKIFHRIYSRGHIDVFPELLTMESLYLSTETVSTIVRSVKLHPVGNAKESLDDLDKGFMRRFEHFTRLNSQQSSLSSAAATTLAKMLPSLELLEELGLSNAGLDEVDVEKVLKALKSCKKLKLLYLGTNTVGAKGATALVEMLPSFLCLKLLNLQNVSLDEEVKTKLRATRTVSEIIF